VNAIVKAAEQYSDQWWRLNNLYYIINKAGKRQRFILNDSQKALYDDLWHRNVILKARQRGFTTFLDIFALDTCVFNPDYSAGIIAHNLDDAKKIFRTKVKYPYDSLPEGIKDLVSASNDRANELVFSNNSSISVSTSYRSGTLQFLHVSEFGKIAAKHPEKSTEIITGAFEAVPMSGIIVVESTAEGNGGDFYEIVQDARASEDAGKRLTPLDFKFVFEPWWANPEYVLDGDVIITNDFAEYFSKVESEAGIKIAENQRRWYVTKESVLKDKMKREYPSSPDEAFDAAIEGAYYADLIKKARGGDPKRLTRIPIEEGIEVDTFWDLGRNDKNSIWFMQHTGKEFRFVDYYENSGEGLKFYAKILKEKKEKHELIYGKHYLPHDVNVTDLSSSSNKSRKQILEDAGVKPIVVVPRIGDINEGIQMTRDVLPSCWFDKERCSVGIKCLENYRHEWDDKTGTFKSYPLHDWSSNGADAFRQFAQGYKSATESKPLQYKRHYRV
jgi:hypothetical protein